MINTEKNIFELEKKLSEAYERIRELENVIAELKAGMMPSQTWKIDHNRNDEWLLDKDTITEQQSRIHRTKTVIDSSVIEELRIEKKDIQLKEHIGKGSFGIVWKANYKDVNVAVKVFLSEEVDVSREISTMAKTKGLPHVLDLIGVVLEEDDPYKPSQIALVMKYMSNGSLQDICYKDSNSYHSNLSNEMKLKFSYQAAKGVLNLHSKNIIHRDLACRNLLVDDKLDVYVADFGFARLKHVTNSKEFTATKLGPVRWEAPESLERKEYSEKTDSFSFGVCIYEIISGKQPWDFCTTPTMVAVNVLRGNRLQIPINCDPVLANLAWNCWHSDPTLRPSFSSMVTILNDRYNQVLEDTRAIEKELFCIEFMISGVDVLKYPFLKSDDKFKSKKPQSRFLRLKSDLKSIVWRSSAANSVFSSASKNKVAERGIDIIEILDVKVGFATENFKLHHATPQLVSSSFSIITANRSLDITCESASHRDLWVWGIRYLLNRLREAHSNGNELVAELKLNYFSSQAIALHSLQRLPLTALPTHPSAFQSQEYLNLLRSIVYRLQRGDIVVKFKSNNKVHAKRVYLSADLTEIVWNMKDEEEGITNKRAKNKSILLAEIDTITYDPPNFFFGNSRVAAVAANISESLLRRHMSTMNQQVNASFPSNQSDRISKKDRGSADTYDPENNTKKTRPRKPSQDSVGTLSQLGGQASSSTWVQTLIPSLKREKSEDPYGLSPPVAHDNLGSAVSETDTDARPDDEQEHGLHAEDIDAQYCISYLRHDGKILLAIQCPNRAVFDLWTDGLSAVIISLKHSRSQTAATYNSGTEFNLPTELGQGDLFDQNNFESTHAVISQLSRYDSEVQDILSPSSEMTEVMHHSRDVSFDHRSDEHDETKRNSRQYDHMKSGWLHENSETKDVFSDIDHSIPRRPSNHQYIPMKGSSQIQELKKEIDSFSNIEHGQYEHRLIDV